MDDNGLNTPPRAAGRSGFARRRRAAGGSDRPQRDRAAHRLDHPQGARPRAPAGCSTRTDRAARAQAAERQLAELADPPGLYYLTLAEWVQEWLFPVYRRSVLGHDRVWCPQWWRHAEAVARLESLWRAWEHLRQDAATGLSVWFRDHADHHMTVLLDADGPFKGCDGRHSDRPLEAVAARPAPGGHVRARGSQRPHDRRRERQRTVGCAERWTSA